MVMSLKPHEAQHLTFLWPTGHVLCLLSVRPPAAEQEWGEVVQAQRPACTLPAPLMQTGSQLQSRPGASAGPSAALSWARCRLSLGPCRKQALTPTAALAAAGRKTA